MGNGKPLGRGGSILYTWGEWMFSQKMAWGLILSTVLLMTGCGTQPAVKKVSIPSLNNFHQFAGEPTIVDLFASSCMYCAYEAKNNIPPLMKWAHKHHVHLVLVNASATTGLGKAGQTPATGVDGTWTPTKSAKQMTANLSRWAEFYHLVGHVYQNPSYQFVKQFKMKGYPTLVVLNKQGHVVFDQAGVQKNSVIEQAVKTLGQG